MNLRVKRIQSKDKTIIRREPVDLVHNRRAEIEKLHENRHKIFHISEIDGSHCNRERDTEGKYAQRKERKREKKNRGFEFKAKNECNQCESDEGKNKFDDSHAEFAQWKNNLREINLFYEVFIF